MSMEFWDLPGTGSAQQQDETSPLREALDALTQRRLTELGAGWRAAPQRTQLAEAGRRARRELARRIGRHTGKKAVSEQTIARRARQATLPPGVEKFWLDRWAAIDRAGGIAKLAQQIGAGISQVRRWRDSPDPDAKMPIRRGRAVRIPVSMTVIRIKVTGSVVINAKEYPRDIPTDPNIDYDTIEVDPGGDLLQAFYDGDDEQLKDELGEQIAMQIITATWDNLPSTYQIGYLVDEVVLFEPED
ncbi:XRE family transcriptional regulator [Mycobacterium sp. smrl_JER01]|uniref:hypothetical protein n=2 Tax=Mycobacterium sp. smrl_JER01 TaxID=3402633 RepID=UPI003D764687